MIRANDLKNCRVIIKELASGNAIADTRIQEFDANRNVLKISASSIAGNKERQISAIVFCRNEGIREYYGRVKRTVTANQVEIELAKGSDGEKRKRQRYDLREKGVIEAIEIEETRIELRKPMEMQTKNISSNGVLFEGMPGSFVPGDCIWIYLQLGDEPFRRKCKVLRIQNSSLKTEEYGCMMLKA